MLKKHNRLGKITRGKENKLFTSPLFNVRISENAESQLRFAFIVSKKIDKRAVVRNRTKRILRSCVEDLLIKISFGHDVVVIAKRELELSQKENAETALAELLKKANIIQ